MRAYLFSFKEEGVQGLLEAETRSVVMLSNDHHDTNRMNEVSVKSRIIHITSVIILCKNENEQVFNSGILRTQFSPVESEDHAI